MSASKPKLILTRGLPGCGKTTWAKSITHTGPRSAAVRVSRDDIRRMLGYYDDFSAAREQLVTQIERAAVVNALMRGKSVIVDDCNLNPVYIEEWKAVATECGMEVEIKDFTHVSLRECLKRNAQRSGDERIPNKIIHQMYAAWLAPKKPVVDPDKPSAIICDLDGTLAIIGDRNPYDASQCDRLDTLNEPVSKLVKKFQRDGHHLIFMSGREEKDREPTERFLIQHGFWGASLHMRTTGDKRPDTQVKRELFETYVEPHYNIEFCIDDRDSVVDLWRSMGLTCFQVGEGWF